MMKRIVLRWLWCAALLCSVGCASAPRVRNPVAATETSKAKAEATYRHVVAADHEIASRAGFEMLRKGGNAVDAAVATSFALSVVRPYACGIGGGGFMLIRLQHHPKLGDSPRTIALDYREVAPSWARPDFFETDPKCKNELDASTHGAHAVAIPGTVAGLLYALENYGTLPREVVMEPAIRAAEQGYPVDASYIRSSQNDEVMGYLKKDPARVQRFARFYDLFLKGGTIKAGDVLRLPGQAKALRLIAKEGAKAYYSGDIATQIRIALKADGVDLNPKDLSEYKPKELSPLTTSVHGKRVLAFPPPSSGGIVLVQVLGMIDARRTEFDGFEYAGSKQVHFLAEALKHSFADRSRYLADPAFVDVPVLALTSQANTRDLAGRIDMAHTQVPGAYGSHLPGIEPAPGALKDSGTSHLCTVDSWGNAVACTETINLVFGSMVCVPEYGFVLNDQMDDFTTRRGEANAFGLRQDDRNLPAPGKQPLSSMSPTIVLGADRDDAPVELVVGAAGGPRIISGTLQVLLDTLVYGIPCTSAVTQARMHHQWAPDILRLEPDLADARERSPGGTRTVRESLELLGHSTKVGGAESVVQVIRRSPEHPARYEAASDPRRGGKPAGE